MMAVNKNVCKSFHLIKNNKGTVKYTYQVLGKICQKKVYAPFFSRKKVFALLIFLKKSLRPPVDGPDPNTP